MTSLVKNAALLGITYSVSSLSVLSSSHLPENALVDNNKPYFHSAYSASNQWWQISFSKQVAISSYLIKTGANYGRRLTAWHVNASNDNVTWRTVHTVTGKDIGGNTEKFYPNSTVHCLHFRIIHDLNTWGDNVLHLTFFDCFGEISSIPSQSPTNKVKHYCNTWCKQYLITFQLYILTLINFIT